VSREYDLLVVEDEPVVLSAIKRILQQEKFRIDEALNVDSALEKLMISKYRLIMTDLLLPKKSGLELLQSIEEKYPEIPVIIITGYATLENALKSFKLGSFDFIAKPFDIEALLGVVQRGLKYSRARLGNPTYSPAYIPIQQPPEEKSLSNKIYCLGGHAWVKQEDGGTVQVGLGETFPNMIDQLDHIEIAAVNDEVMMGKCCARFLTKDGLVNMFWAPLSGRVIAANNDIIENVERLNSVPFDSGWLFRILPTNPIDELAQLTLCQRNRD